MCMYGSYAGFQKWQIDQYILKDWIIFCSVLVGIVAYWLIMWIFCQIMQICFSCEQLSNFDAVWLLDRPDNLCYAIGVWFFEPFEFEEMKQHMLDKTQGVHRCRSKLVLKFGLWYFQKMSRDEWATKKEGVVQEKNGIHTPEDLCKYLCEE
jgi:hypothetical protein